MKEAAPGVPPKCDQCEEAIATLRSERLDAYLCESCNTMLSKTKVLRTHGPVKLEDWTPPVMCTHHKRPVELFCYEDQILICLECVASSHKGHLAEAPLTAYKLAVAPNLNTLKTNISPQEAEFESILSQLSEFREQLLSSTPVFPQIKNRFKQVRASLDYLEQSTLEQVQTHINVVQEELCEAQLSVLSSYCNLSKMVEDVGKFQDEKEPVTAKTAIAFFAKLEKCQSFKRCSVARDLKVTWHSELFSPPKQKLELPTLHWESNQKRLLPKHNPGNKPSFLDSFVHYSGFHATGLE